MFERLYHKGKSQIERRRLLKDYKLLAELTKDEKDLLECTFAPKINAGMPKFHHAELARERRAEKREHLGAAAKSYIETVGSPEEGSERKPFYTRLYEDAAQRRRREMEAKQRKLEAERIEEAMFFEPNTISTKDIEQGVLNYMQPTESWRETVKDMSPARGEEGEDQEDQEDGEEGEGEGRGENDVISRLEKMDVSDLPLPGSDFQEIGGRGLRSGDVIRGRGDDDNDDDDDDFDDDDGGLLDDDDDVGGDGDGIGTTVLSGEM